MITLLITSIVVGFICLAIVIGVFGDEAGALGIIASIGASFLWWYHWKTILVVIALLLILIFIGVFIYWCLPAQRHKIAVWQLERKIKRERLHQTMEQELERLNREYEELVELPLRKMREGEVKEFMRRLKG